MYPYKVILKTCGTTTLLNAVSKLLEIARTDCALVELCNVFYSRKNFRDPSKQRYPHSSFHDEVCAELCCFCLIFLILSLKVQVLDSMFAGSAYVLGQINGDHCMKHAQIHLCLLVGFFLVSCPPSKMYLSWCSVFGV